YMGKARFMPRIGFRESLGARELAPDTEIEGWGLMDDVFFTKAGDRVLRLAEREEPWFATLLNVGTHHPFPQAPRVESAVEEWQEFDRGVAAGTAELGKKRQTSFSAMTQELLALLERLDDNGVFDDTLVVVTSDESGGFIEKADDVRETNLLAGNFGFMAVRPPAGMARDALRGRDELVGHIDLALTVADAAGIAEDDPGVDRMIGHSLFARDDDRERGLMLGNTYSGQTFFLLESGQLMVCAETLLRCDDWTFEPDRVIGSLQPEDDGELLDSETRNRLVERAGLIDDGARGE
ncbi:MAG: sulfatase-like hydrolase/transferase, partial [Halofilum sp. (in: g-proteobacteria)]